MLRLQVLQVSGDLKFHERAEGPTFLHGAGWGRRMLSRALGLVSPFVAYARLDLDGLRALAEATGFTVDRCEQLPGLFPLAYLLVGPLSEGAGA